MTHRGPFQPPPFCDSVKRLEKHVCPCSGTNCIPRFGFAASSCGWWVFTSRASSQGWYLFLCSILLEGHAFPSLKIPYFYLFSEQYGGKGFYAAPCPGWEGFFSP